MQSAHRWRVGVIIALALLATTAPYLVGWATADEARPFSGGLIGVDDFHSYIGKMRLGAEGVWDFYLFYTPEPHEPVAGVFLAYILPGQLIGRLFAEDSAALTPALIATFHAMRIAFNILLILVLDRFIGHFFPHSSRRSTALWLAVFGGGLGWLLLGAGNWLGSLPVDLFVPEAFTFLILLTLPHLALARAALFGGFLCLFRALEGGWRYTVMAGLLWMLVGLIVPFYLALLYALLGVWGLLLWLRRRRFPRELALKGGLAAAMTLPLFGYYAVAFAANPVFSAWSAQNLLPSPHPLHYIAAYGLYLTLGFLGLRWAWRQAQRRPAFALLIAWVGVGLLLVYLPINVQRRMGEGILIPLAILTSYGLTTLLRSRVRKRRRPRLQLVAITSLSLTSLILAFGALVTASSMQPPVHLSAAQVDAFAWLDQHAPPNSVVLSSMPTGNRLPAYTDLRPYVGHGPETLGAETKRQQVERYFRGQLTAEERDALYQSVDIRYVLLGEEERELAQESASNDWQQDLQLIYDGEGVQIFEVAARDTEAP